MDCRSLRFLGRPGDEGGPGHQVECGILQCRDPGGRHMAAWDDFGARRQRAGFGRARCLAIPDGASAVGAVPNGASGNRMLKAEKTAGRRRRYPSSRNSPKLSANSSRFSPKSGTRNPWRRYTVGPRVGACRRPRAGLTACRPRMNVPATGIIHAGSGSLTKESGDGRTHGPGLLRLRCRIKVSNGRHCKIQLAPRDRVPT